MAKKKTEESAGTIATTQVQVYSSALPSTPARLENIRLELIRPSEKNPRKQYTDQAIMELADSISAQGLLQPITIRPIQGEMFKYEIVCGERRYRAVKYLMQETIPAIIREMTDAEAYDAMITENLQREDLDLIDEGVAYRLLVDAGQSVPELAARFGKSEKYIRGRMHLDALTDDLKRMLRMQLLPLTGAQLLSRLTDEKKIQFYKEVGYRADSLRPININDITAFIRQSSYDLKRSLFLHDGNESLNNDESWSFLDKPNLCATCPFNTASQFTLFPEMAEQSLCTLSDCYDDKLRRYGHYLINLHSNELLIKGQEISIDSLVLAMHTTFLLPPRKKIVEELKNEYGDKFEFIKTEKFSRCYRNPRPDDRVFRVIDISTLAGEYENPIQYYYLPEDSDESSSSSDFNSSWHVYRDLKNHKAKQEEELYNALQPLYDEYKKSDIGSDFFQESEQYNLAMFVLNEVFDVDFKDKYGLPIYEADLNIASQMFRTITWEDFLRLILQYYIDNAGNTRALEHIALSVAAPAAKPLIDEIKARYAPATKELTDRLAAMGYDEEMNPIETDDDDSDNDDDSDDDVESGDTEWDDPERDDYEN